jgi:2-phosphosulfolactate phosphatase
VLVTCEWGIAGLRGARAAGATIVIVDVLSFSTAVDVAVGRGAAIHPYSGARQGLREFAISVGAVAAGRRGDGGYSLSPASYLDVPAGTRVALRSVNGGALSEAATGPLVYTGCLRNARAVAEALGNARHVALIPAGERREDGTLRPSIEDWLGAGAVASHLRGERCAEAELAARSFESARADIRALLAGSRSGRELVDAGFETDIELAAEVDVSDVAPLLRDSAYVNARTPGG